MSQGIPARCSWRIRKTAAVAPPAGTAWLNPVMEWSILSQVKKGNGRTENQGRHHAGGHREAALRTSAVAARTVKARGFQ
jgi:hypothetical protein